MFGNKRYKYKFLNIDSDAHEKSLCKLRWNNPKSGYLSLLFLLTAKILLIFDDRTSAEETVETMSLLRSELNGAWIKENNQWEFNSKKNKTRIKECLIKSILFLINRKNKIGEIDISNAEIQGIESRTALKKNKTKFKKNK